MAGWRLTLLLAVVAHGIWPIRKPFVLRFRVPFSVIVVSLRCSGSVRETFRTAVYGPVRTVVWQGSAGDRRPYADLTVKVVGINDSRTPSWQWIACPKSS